MQSRLSDETESISFFLPDPVFCVTPFSARDPVFCAMR